MKHHLNRKVVARATAVAAMAVLAANCSSQSNASTATTSTSGGGGTKSTVASGLTTTQQAALKVFIDANKSQPTFTKPGPAFNGSAAKGKSVFFIPNSSTVAFNASAAAATQQALQQVGVKTTIFPTTGQVSDYQRGIQAAISQQANEIILLSIDPTLVAPQIDAAKAAGIPTIVVHAGSADYQPPADVAAVVPAPYTLAGQLEAAYALYASTSKPDILIVGHTDNIAGKAVNAGTMGELAKYCPSCTTKNLDIPVASWATQIQPEVASALVTDPNINYVVAAFDAEAQYIIPAITAAGKQSTLNIATYNGTPSVLTNIEDKTSVSMDVGESAGWLGWAFADQALRVLTGTTPVPDEHTPVRIWDSSNVAQTGTPPVVNQGYGSAYIAGYKQLWGLS